MNFPAHDLTLHRRQIKKLNSIKSLQSATLDKYKDEAGCKLNENAGDSKTTLKVLNDSRPALILLGEGAE